MISVRRARVLPLPSFRFRLTTDTLGFGYDLPAAGQSRDFHPLERALAGRTTEAPGESGSPGGVPRGGAPLLGISIRVGLGRGRNRNLPLPSVVSLCFFLFGQAKRKNIRPSPHSPRRTVKPKIVPRGRPQGSPLRFERYVVIQFRTQNSELRTPNCPDIGPYDRYRDDTKKNAPPRSLS